MQEVSDPYLSVIERGLLSGLECGSLEAAGRDGDLRIRTKSIHRAEMLLAPNWFSRSRSVRSFRPCGSSTFSHLLYRRLSAVRCTSVMQQQFASDTDNPHSSSASPKSLGPSCWPRRSLRAFWVFFRAFALTKIRRVLIFAPASSTST